MKTTTLLLALCALSLALASQASAAEEFDRYAVESVGASLSSNQAGAHADMTISFALSEDEEHRPFARTRDLFFNLPPGVIGNPQNFPRCTVAQFGSEPKQSECPQDAQIGITEVTLHELGTLIEPVYNMPSPGGDVVARFGLYAGIYPAVVNLRVNPIDYSVTAAVEGASAAAELISARTTIWGIPAAESHDEQRLTPAEAAVHEFPVGGRKSGQPEIPFLSNPTDCSLKREISVKAVSYQLPSQPSSKSAPFPQISGCGKLSFSPKFTLTPTNPEAFAPTGVDATLTIPQDEAPQDLATSTMKSAVVTLPEGLVINPSAGDGLEGCSAAQVGFGTTEPSHCPGAAKIGSVEVDVPALEHTLNGAVYQRTPETENGETKLFRFWVVSDEQGVHLKLPAEIQPNKLTGQLTNLFLGIPSLGGNPQVPFAQLRLHVFGGPKAPLATPACGSYATHYAFAPWSGNPATEGDAPMQITQGCNKGGFAPKLEAGSSSSFAGAYSPFAMTLTRQDGEGNPQTLSLHLPRGLLAKLGGVPLCGDAEATTGDCPASSQIGNITAAAGVGSSPLWIPQPGKDPTAVYLAGPYKGAPYSIVAKVPAQAGPFDLGTVINRSAINVDPESATATITTDPLPQILEGVPISLRTLHVEVNRSEFTLNPTSCDAKSIQATVTAASGAVATPSVGFQATNCARLPYAPHLKLTLKGQTKRTGHPAVQAVLTQKPGQANTAEAQVILPPSEFIDQNHINNPCTRVQFAANACPPLSVLGTATATTPLLDQPLSGPVYFRSNGGERELPDVVADLHGPIHVILVGFVDAVHKKGSEESRIRTTFANVPDAPVSKFTMQLFGGKKRGLLVNSKPLCKTNRRVKLSFTGQNGLVDRSEPKLVAKCGKGKKK
ncbi:MAG TPA: hypothetical protein VFX44_02780 [Solirubrobacterales bacterium]|nr:hypothetical protein [Solirubrobacterales bacterium]